MLAGNDTADGEDPSSQKCVTIPPVIDDDGEKEKPIPLLTGSSFVLNCPTNTKPKPKVVWFKDGRQMENRDGNVFSFALLDVTSQEAGRYVCRVFNDAGSANLTFIVTVQGNHDVWLKKPV